MVKVSYSIYCLYTDDNEIYIGLSKNPRVRIDQHRRKSSNERLRKLFDEKIKKVYSSILFHNLTQEQANQLEKALIKQYKEDPHYTILNIQSGGLRGNNKISKSPEKISKSEKWISDIDVVKIRYKYKAAQKPIDFKKEAKLYNLGHKYFIEVLKGSARKRLPGPRLGKEYTNDRL